MSGIVLIGIAYIVILSILLFAGIAADLLNRQTEKWIAKEVIRELDDIREWGKREEALTALGSVPFPMEFYTDNPEFRWMFDERLLRISQKIHKRKATKGARK